MQQRHAPDHVVPRDRVGRDETVGDDAIVANASKRVRRRGGTPSGPVDGAGEGVVGQREGTVLAGPDMGPLGRFTADIAFGQPVEILAGRPTRPRAATDHAGQPVAPVQPVRRIGDGTHHQGQPVIEMGASQPEGRGDVGQSLPRPPQPYRQVGCSP